MPDSAAYYEAVGQLARAHAEVSDRDLKVYLIEDDGSGQSTEEIRLIEVSEGFLPDGGDAVLVVGFRPSDTIPYRSAIALVPPGEFEEIKDGRRSLPPGWNAHDLRLVWPSQ